MGACAAPLCHLPLLQKFNAMIYLPFREDARIVHMHGCVSACLPMYPGLAGLAHVYLFKCNPCEGTR